MKAIKLSFDFSDKPHLPDLLRRVALERGVSQKRILIEALEAFFADKLKNQLVAKSAESAFRDWDNEEDQIYDQL